MQYILRSAALAAGLCLSAAAGAQTAPLYHLTDLGHYSFGAAINSSGRIVGWNTHQKAAFWRDGVWHAVAGGGALVGINDANLIAGDTYTRDHGRTSVATRWDATGKTATPLAADMAMSDAFGIRNDGTIWGSAQQGRETPWVFSWRKGVMSNLGNYQGQETTPMDMNAKGQIAGIVYGSPWTAVTYVDGAWKAVPGFGGGNDAANAINDDGLIAGNSAQPADSGFRHPFTYDGTTLTDLGLPAGAVDGNVRGINNAGDVVGGIAFSPDDDAQGFAMLWRGGQMYTLENYIDATSPHVHLEQATAINDAGQIVAVSWYLDNAGTHAFLLTPVAAR